MKMKVDNVKSFLKFFRTLPDTAVDMERWIVAHSNEAATPVPIVIARKAACGTTGCIAGWCQAFIHRNDSNIVVSQFGLHIKDPETGADVRRGRGMFKDYVCASSEEARKFFGLTIRDAQCLFVKGPWGSRPGKDSTPSALGSGAPAKRAIIKQLEFMIKTGTVVMLTVDDITVGSWYRAKRYRGTPGWNNDRVVAWINPLRTQVQYDSNTISTGRRRPTVSMLMFLNWVRRKCTDEEVALGVL